jgi:hypothetical protein
LAGAWPDATATTDLSIEANTGTESKKANGSPLSAVDAVYFLEIQPWKGTTNMTIEDLIAVLMDIIPDAQLGEDEDGQIVIYTGLKSQQRQTPTPQPNQR